MKSFSHDGNLLVCLDIPRPIRERKVATSGTKGVGEGTRGEATFLWRWRIDCLEDLRRRDGRRVNRRGLDTFILALLAW